MKISINGNNQAVGLSANQLLLGKLYKFDSAGWTIDVSKCRIVRVIDGYLEIDLSSPQQIHCISNHANYKGYTFSLSDEKLTIEI